MRHDAGMASVTEPLAPLPRAFTSPGDAARNLAGLAVHLPPLAHAYLRGALDALLRERVVVAVSRANACAGCTTVHERWALRAGVSSEDLDAIELGDLARLDDRSRAAIIYATDRANARFQAAPDDELTAMTRRHLTAGELRAVEAVSRLMTFANLTANTPGRDHHRS